MINFESSSRELSFNSSYQVSVTITQLVATPTNHQIRQSWLSQNQLGQKSILPLFSRIQLLILGLGQLIS